MLTPILESIDWTQLIEKGWWAGNQAIPKDLMNQLRLDCLSEWESGDFEEAGTGAGLEHGVRKNVRRDYVKWWSESPASPVRSSFLEVAESLRQEINQALFIALHEVELHYAVYPEGGFYKRHLDQFRGRNNRQISLVCFLNPEWSPEDGGQLRIYSDQGFHDILPLGGTLVLFRSDLIEHEVLPTRRQRLSLTGWFKNRAWPLI